MNPIDELFRSLRAAGRKAFMPFVTAGDPDAVFTRELLPAVAESGANLIEVGFPFSDPIADGPVVQASYTRALSHGLKLADVFDTLKQVTSTPGWQTPLTAMASYSLIFKKGAAAFLDACARRPSDQLARDIVAWASWLRQQAREQPVLEFRESLPVDDLEVPDGTHFDLRTCTLAQDATH